MSLEPSLNVRLRLTHGGVPSRFLAELRAVSSVE